MTSLTSVAFFIGLSSTLAYAEGGYGPNLLPAGDFTDVRPNYVPWAGVDDKNFLHGIDGKQLCVSDDGNIAPAPFSPSLGVADMNDDGKPDIVMADAYGFFWYYPNSGTLEKPAFTQGEVIPIWLGEEVEANNGSYEGVNNVVPRLQVIDVSGLRKFDIVAGNYAGKLFRIPNIGSGSKPNFNPTMIRDRLLVPTHRSGVLWCNYLAPFFTTAFGEKLGGRMDLIMGEGTYSANSIYLLRNTGSNEQPTFDEDHLSKIIPGYGLEQIVPVVVDWNNDGKPDVLAGSRTGNVVLYLNNSVDKATPTFAPGENVSIGGQEKLGSSITVTVCDLTNNKLPNLLVGRSDGTVAYALNTGTLDKPGFTTLLSPVMGVLPPTFHYTQPTAWNKDGMWGAPDELLACVNPQIEPGFAFPKDSKAKYALKFSVWPITNVNFPVRYYPPHEYWANEHYIGCSQIVRLQMKTQYRLHYWVKSEGAVNNMRARLVPEGSDEPHPDDIIWPENSGTDWTEVTENIRIDNSNFKDISDWGFHFEFRFNGQTTFYISGLEIQQVKE